MSLFMAGLRSAPRSGAIGMEFQLHEKNLYTKEQDPRQRHFCLRKYQKRGANPVHTRRACHDENTEQERLERDRALDRSGKIFMDQDRRDTLSLYQSFMRPERRNHGHKD